MSREVFVARQPIFDRRRRVHGYELLFRAGPVNACPVVDGTAASRYVVQASWVDLGLDVLVGRTRAFVNVTQDLLVSGLTDILPPESTVIEVLETVEPDDELVQACRALKRAGYVLALDDFIYRPGLDALIPLADIIKIRLGECDAQEQCEHARRHAGSALTLLAEKVETQQDFERALALGFDLFQGWFFCRPELIAGQALTGSQASSLKLMEAVSREPLEIDEIVTIIQSDVSLTHRLLKFMGSAAFPWRKQIRSVRNALVLLGERQTRRWISLVSMSDLAQGKPPELLMTAAIRAKFCDGLGEAAGMHGRDGDLYLLGALSLIDAMLGQPMPTVLEHLPLAQDLKDTLEGRPNLLRPVLAVAETYERADWAEFGKLCAQLRVAEANVAPLYRAAVDWSTQVLVGASGSGG